MSDKPPLNQNLLLKWIAAIDNHCFKNGEWVQWADDLQSCGEPPDQWVVDLCVAWTGEQAVAALWEGVWRVARSEPWFSQEACRIGFLYQQYLENQTNGVVGLLQQADRVMQSICEDNRTFYNLLCEAETHYWKHEPPEEFQRKMDQAFQPYITIAEACITELKSQIQKT